MEIDFSLFDRYRSTLNEVEKQRLTRIRHPEKKLEFAASRHLKHHLFGEAHIEYDLTGAPVIEGVGYISISHCSSHVVLACCKEHLIGVDIEEIRDKSVKTSRRFITEKEKTFFDQQSEKDMSLLWSFKECLYKLSDRNQLLFQRDILVEKRADSYYGCIQKTDGIYEYELHVENFKNILITFNSGKGKLVHGHSG